MSENMSITVEVGKADKAEPNRLQDMVKMMDGEPPKKDKKYTDTGHYGERKKGLFGKVK